MKNTKFCFATDLFFDLKDKAENLTSQQISAKVHEIYYEIEGTDSSMLSVLKRWRGYGTWKSEVFVNDYYFGRELTDIIIKSCNGKITHDEDKEFKIEDFKEYITETIFDSVYF